MRSEASGGNTAAFGSLLSEELKKTFAEDKQSIVFINRRGYSSAVSCRKCGEALKCPNCSVSLTYHAKMPIGDTDSGEQYLTRRRQRGVLSCHYCGYKTAVPEICPSCSSEHFRYMGCGTQQAEEELERILPAAKILRMDMDTTKSKNSHEKITKQFRDRKGDVLLGTQMVTKGHDFPYVTLVGVLNADQSLFLDDYRAEEKTFSMLTQVIGRAGRGRDAGLAVVQTSNPDSEVIRLAANQDYKAFFEKAIKLRRALLFPPFCDIAVVTVSSNDEALLSSISKQLGDRAKELLRGDYSGIEMILFGPFEAPIYKVQNICRQRLVVKCRLGRETRQFIATLLREFGKIANVTVTADLNPSSL